MTQPKNNDKQLESPDFLRQLVQTYLHEYLEQEVAVHLGALPYERIDDRRGHRNGYKPRQLNTRVGKLVSFGASDPGRFVFYRAFRALTAQ